MTGWAEVPAAELMTRPVQAVGPETRLSEAHALLLRTGHGALPVVTDGRPVGIIDRHVCERAVRHGLGDRPVAEAMSPEVPIVTPDSPARAVIDLLANPPGRLVVADDSGLCGIITRSDVVLRLFGRTGGAGAAASGAGDAGAGGDGAGDRSLDASPLLELRWDPEELRTLRRIGSLAAGRRLYLVGGAVRDLLLDRPSYDLDLMVEEDAGAFARAIATAVGGTVSVHAPFGTATVSLPDGHRIDVATSRAELYARPGALPDVTPAGLMHDLARRDFTVNALAMRVDPEGRGRVVDPFGGLADLRERRLRILHSLSFVEDPTRLVRAIRFERALGMRMEPRTEELARFALASSRLDGLGGERLKTELGKLLGAPGFAAGVSRMTELDAWRLLHAGLAGSKPDVEALESLEDLVTDWPALRREDLAAARFRGVLAIVLAPLGEPGARDALAGLHSASDDARAVLQAIAAEPMLADLGRMGADTASVRFERLRHLGPDALRHLAARSGDRAAIRMLAGHEGDRSVRLAGVDGDWLREQGVAPGPLMGRVLSDTLHAVLDGKISGQEAERRFALERARELGSRC